MTNCSRWGKSLDTLSRFRAPYALGMMGAFQLSPVCMPHQSHGQPSALAANVAQKCMSNVWQPTGKGVHLVGHPAVLQDHGQMEDASHRRHAICHRHNLFCLSQVSHIQRGDLHLCGCNTSDTPISRFTEDKQQALCRKALPCDCIKQEHRWCSAPDPCGRRGFPGSGWRRSLV